MSNINPDTGIRYGVISLNSLNDYVFDEFFYNGRNLTFERALQDFKDENSDATDDDIDDAMQYWECDECEYYLEIEGMKLGITYLGGAAMVWIYESPHTANVKLCSPCVPNAGDLDNKIADGFICYDLPADWYNKE
jgi:hypothetical protein